MRTFFLAIIFLTVITSSAQMLDSIKNSFNYHPVFFIKLDTRNSFISSYSVKLRGVKAGLNYNNITKIGLGYSWMNPDYNSVYNTDTVEFKMNIFSTFIEYTFYRTDKIYAEIPVHLGISKLSYLKEDNLLSSTFALVYEPAMIVEYRAFKFFGLGIGAGYRLVLYNHQQINEMLSSPIYIFRFKVYFGDIYKQHLKKQ